MWEPMVDVFGIKPATCLQVPYLMNKITLYTYIYTSSTQQRHTSSVILWVWRCGDKLDELCSSLFKKTVFAGAAGSVCCQKMKWIQPTSQNKTQCSLEAQHSTKINYQNWEQCLLKQQFTKNDQSAQIMKNKSFTRPHLYYCLLITENIAVQVSKGY